MRKKFLVMTGILTVSIFSAAVVPAAESTGETPKPSLEERLASLFDYKDAANDLFGEEGLLNELLPEGTDVEGLIDTVEEEIDLVKEKGSEAIDLIKSKLTKEDGSLDLSILEGLGGELIAALGGGSDDSAPGGIDKILRQYEAIQNAVKEYNIGKNAEFMDPGDVQLVSLASGYVDEHPEIEGIEYQGEIKTAEELTELRSEFLDELSSEETAESFSAAEEIVE